MSESKKLETKKKVVLEIIDKIKKSSAVIFFDYRGLSVNEIGELRSNLRNVETEVKVYKNSLTRRALAKFNYDIINDIIGPNAIAFSNNVVEPLKVIDNYANKYKKLKVKMGIIDGEIADAEKISKLAKIPTRDTLLTMLAGGMIGILKDLSKCLHLLSEEKVEN